eukprot:1473723-Prymnesium_polylepis.1
MKGERAVRCDGMLHHDEHPSRWRPCAVRFGALRRASARGPWQTRRTILPRHEHIWTPQPAL